MKLLNRNEYSELSSQVKLNIIVSLIIFISSIVTLISTFTFLQTRSLSFIPLVSIFASSVSVFLLIINVIRFNVIGKVIEGEYKIDPIFLKLLFCKLIIDEEEQKGSCEFDNELSLIKNYNLGEKLINSEIEFKTD